MASMTEKDKEFLKTYNADEYEHHSVTVDMLIFTANMKGKLELLLIRRKHPPYQDCWALPGGFVNIDESLDTAAARELEEETGITDVHMEQLYTFGAVGRDPRTRVISVAYIAMVPHGMLKPVAGDDAAEAVWYEVGLGENGKPIFNKDINLAFDHEEIIAMAVERMRGKINYSPIALEFLSDRNRFAIYEVQKIHEAVLGKKLDVANFRRSFLTNYVDKGIVCGTGEKCTQYYGRPSSYYKLKNDHAKSN